MFVFWDDLKREYRKHRGSQSVFKDFISAVLGALAAPVHQMCMRRKQRELRSELREILYFVTKRE